MNTAALPLSLALIGGFMIALQAPTNAMLAKATQSPIVAAFISFLVGAIALGILVAATSGRLFAPQLKLLPWYAWMGGLYGAVFVTVLVFAAPRVGVTALLTTAIAGQLLAAVIIDHYGLMGLTRQTVSFERIGGVALVLLGAFLVSRR